MKKSDLKTGMVVEIKNGDKLMLIGNVLVDCDGYMELKEYNDDLTNIDDDDLGFSIIKVYEANKTYQLCENNWDDMPCIWDREKEVDWSKVSVDTKILVNLTGNWLPAYFAKYENGRVYAWGNGRTSWTARADHMTHWEEVKLYEEKTTLENEVK